MNSNVPMKEKQPEPTGAPSKGGRLIDRARNAFWMAPMSGITDVCYRQLMDEMGAGVLVSELVSAKGLVFNSERTRRMIAIPATIRDEAERLIVRWPPDLAIADVAAD